MRQRLSEREKEIQKEPQGEHGEDEKKVKERKMRRQIERLSIRARM